MKLDLLSPKKAATRAKREAKRQARYDAHTSMRTCMNTPAIRDFLHRDDVQWMEFGSGSFHVFVGDYCGGPTPFVADTLQVAAEKAMAWDAKQVRML